MWADTNGDGYRDSAEPGLGGVSVDLYMTGSGHVASTTTTTTGLYLFTGLAAGEYYVVFELPIGYTFTATPNPTADQFNNDSDVTSPAGRTSTFTITVGEYEVDVDAGFLPG